MKLRAAILLVLASGLTSFAATVISNVVKLSTGTLGSFPPGAKGAALFETAGNTVWGSNGVGWSRLGVEATTTDAIPGVPFSPSRINTVNRQSATTFEGGMYLLDRKITFSKIHIRVMTGTNPNCRLRLLIYQTADGKSGVTSLKATVTNFLVNTAGQTTFTMTPAEGSVTLVPGRFYVLWGTEADLFSVRSNFSATLSNITSNVPAALSKVRFTTALTVTAAPPATFDPVASATTNTNGMAPALRLSQ
jgi:hypothetical protein